MVHAVKVVVESRELLIEAHKAGIPVVERMACLIELAVAVNEEHEQHHQRECHHREQGVVGNVAAALVFLAVLVGCGDNGHILRHLNEAATGIALDNILEGTGDIFVGTVHIAIAIEQHGEILQRGVGLDAVALVDDSGTGETQLLLVALSEEAVGFGKRSPVDGILLGFGQRLHLFERCPRLAELALDFQYFSLVHHQSEAVVAVYHSNGVAAATQLGGIVPALLLIDSLGSERVHYRVAQIVEI